jgi:hypothetical protein
MREVLNSSVGQLMIGTVIAVLIYFFVLKMASYTGANITNYDRYKKRSENYMLEEDSAREKYELYTFIIIMMVATTCLLTTYFSKSFPVRGGVACGSMALVVHANYMRWNKFSEVTKLFVIGSILSSIIIFSTIHIKNELY